MKIFISAWGICAVLLLLYSFTQVDLSLTLTGGSFVSQIQRSFQHIGWFDRPLSTYLYIGLVVLITVLFMWSINRIAQKKIGKNAVFLAVFLIAGILVFSYTAFSYDLFNYIFDAKIVTFYHKNPYLFKALDFPGDPMLSFMRSTHRVYPYGPTWLLFTVPLSFAGMNIFTVTFFAFKALAAVSYIVCAWLVYRIATKLDIRSPLIAVALFAFNPLVIIESLVSSHNEIVMMALALWGVDLLVSQKRSLSVVALAVSVGIKYTTVFLLPLYILGILKKKYLTKKYVVPIASVLMGIAVVATSAASGQNKNPEFQPWYLLSLAPFVVLSENKIIRFLFVGVCLGAISSYIPFLWSGSWPVDIVMLKNVLLACGLGAGLIIGLVSAQIGKK